MNPRTASYLRCLAGRAWMDDRLDDARDLEALTVAAEIREREGNRDSVHPFFIRST